MLSGSLYRWLDAWIVSLLEHNLEHTEGVTLYTGQVSTGSEHPAHAKMVPYSDLPKSLVAEAPQQFLSQKWTQCLCWNLNGHLQHFLSQRQSIVRRRGDLVLVQRLSAALRSDILGNSVVGFAATNSREYKSYLSRVPMVSESTYSQVSKCCQSFLLFAILRYTVSCVIIADNHRFMLDQDRKLLFRSRHEQLESRKRSPKWDNMSALS